MAACQEAAAGRYSHLSHRVGVTVYKHYNQVSRGWNVTWCRTSCTPVISIELICDG